MADIAISASDLVKTYPGPTPVHALAGVDVDIAVGEFVGLVGRSGSGKSTLLTLLGLLDEPTSGEIDIAGVSTTSLSRRQRVELRRQHLGFIFQSFNLIPELSAIANVEIALRYQRVPRSRWTNASREALDIVGLSHRWQSRVSTLSGGEQQRVAIARALVKKPQVILADEPTGNLDSDNEEIIISLLKQAAAEGAAVVVATHSTEVSRHAERSYRLHDGAVVS